MKDKLQELNDKIREFVRKYYLNKLLKGAILFVAITLVTFILFALLENFTYLNSTGRSILFYSYLGLFALTFIFYILIPLLKIGGLGKQISKEQVAKLVGEHFTEIDDKFLNIIQLENQLSQNEFKSLDLLIAAIDTKIDEIKPFPFIKAIPFKKTLRYLKWALIPVLVFVLVFSVNSEVFTEPAKRIVNYQQFYEKPAPYTFEILNNQLTAFQNEDFILELKVLGEEVPNEVYVTYGNKSFKCHKVSNTEFTYSFTKIQKNTDFQINTDETTSRIYTIQVLPKPVTISYIMELHYPAYLNKNTDVIDNSGDATVPEGTTVTWKFYTRNTDTVNFIYQDRVQYLIPQDDHSSFSLQARNDFDYAIVNRNSYIIARDTLKHAIHVVKDQYPEIYVESQRDSILERIYFKGNIKDDYGFHDLKFVYSKFDDKGNLLEADQKVDIQINRTNTIQDFYYYFDSGILQMEPGYKVEYYFEVRDNDVINGYKTTKSSMFTYRIKTMEEIDKEMNSNNSQAKADMDEMLKESSDLIKEIEKLNQQLMQNNNPSWQDKKKMETLLQQYQELKAKLDEIKDKQNQQNQMEEQFKNLTPEILDKQRELQKRMEQILTDEMKEMMEKIQEMMNQLNKEQMQDAMERMKTSAEDINKSLDQQLQLFKQLEYEKKVNDIIDKTKQLSAEEEMLSKESQQRNIDRENLVQKQEEIEKKFQQLRQDIKELDQLNKELEDPNKMSNTDELQKQIEQAMQESKESLKKNNRSKAADKQKESAEKMEELADQMENDMLDSQEEDLAEDIETLRQILDNLVRISFNQESTLVKARSINSRSSQLTDVIRDQHMIREHFKLIDDSLNALARRQVQVKPFIQKEVTKINDYLEKSQVNINDRRLPQAASNQQFALTSMNNLALMLAESMKEMKNQMKQTQNCKNSKNSKSGNNSCSNPGQGKKSKTARELQQQLNRQMEALKRSMENEGQKNEGQSGKPGGQDGMSEQLAKMAAQQEAIRKMMQDLQSELKSQDGVGDKSLDQLIRDMEKTEKELVNRTISQQTINRQKNIETRMLESEKAQQQQEKEEKRESTEGRDIRNMNPPKEWQVDKANEKQNEMLKTVPVNLNYYYKEKVNQYFFNIE